jgi:hypothetical protein
MGISIAILWVATVVILVVLMRQKFADPAWGWALRLGMLISVVGSASGGLMLGPTAEQTSARAAHQTVTANGGHTVGAQDGGPGLPGVGWSTEHGDLRIPHFLGLHALQVIPFLAWAFRRGRRPVSVVFVCAGSYLTITAILMAQALGGESIARPGPATLTAVAIWLALSLAGLAATQFAPASRHQFAKGAAS